MPLFCKGPRRGGRARPLPFCRLGSLSPRARGPGERRERASRQPTRARAQAPRMRTPPPPFPTTQHSNKANHHNNNNTCETPPFWRQKTDYAPPDPAPPPLPPARRRAAGQRRQRRRALRASCPHGATPTQTTSRVSPAHLLSFPLSPQRRKRKREKKGGAAPRVLFFLSLSLHPPRRQKTIPSPPATTTTHPSLRKERSSLRAPSFPSSSLPHHRPIPRHAPPSPPAWLVLVFFFTPLFVCSPSPGPNRSAPARRASPVASDCRRRCFSLSIFLCFVVCAFFCVGVVYRRFFQALPLLLIVRCLFVFFSLAFEPPLVV